MAPHKLVLPADFQDYAYEVKAKGWFSGASVQYMDQQFPVTFYDPTRLKQEVDAELLSSPVFSEPNMLVVPVVNEAAMRKAVDHAVARGFLKTLVLR